MAVQVGAWRHSLPAHSPHAPHPPLLCFITRTLIVSIGRRLALRLVEAHSKPYLRRLIICSLGLSCPPVTL
ncbi:hypothetical protein E2C01_055563 [Portunus trituberculatus]|uniref:Uncharacterized protein n=1 Tax=Portunus trituberculatus TaxID=210409 RepID=A0A5B7GN19_PORTR|nr:hypothetical protein [Portunus trituberculatus]